MTPILQRAVSKATWRLLPFLFVLYIAAYLDRINVSFAALGMNKDLGLDQAAYGFGAGIFFLGYVLLEVPSNLVLARVGARRWIARIMVSWGLVTMALAYAQGPVSFAALRFLLGACEAGFFPGIILYLTYWFPHASRARAVALFMTATPVAGLVGSPLSGWIMGLHGVWGHTGWQWLFLLEGLPAVLLGVAVWFTMPAGPAKAAWLTPDERQALAGALEAEGADAGPGRLHGVRQGLTSPVVWLFGFIYFCSVLAMYGLVMFLPQIVAQVTGGDALSVGFHVMVAYGFAAVGMVLIGASSDRFAERRWHVIGSMGLCLCGMVALSAATGLAGVLAGASLAAMGIWGVLGPFWGMATRCLGGAAAAAGIALINSLGNVGGFLGPYLMGWVKSNTGHYSEAFLYVAAVILLGMASALLVRQPRRNG
ncbi:Putative tartrate transporter [Fundidesulfovibrio magnetotacticus]|uniref:Tartrate transporter n=1 Tax=Fundidesulfovibrio magnetotacticus TaxID=2730080 RepID=A0A6V8LZ68_9BACT|nr:MFS transporter [Fundidesulfovibrio magnetotacticus]GFK95841.1 Putative tartrate transporter [Fundidesulfovibrio magnetotacticus]